MRQVREDLRYSIGIRGYGVSSTKPHSIRQRVQMAVTVMQLVSLEKDDLGKKSKREGDELHL